MKSPEIDAQLVAENVALQLERRVSFRRAMKKVLQTAKDFGAEGMKIRCAGRLARSWPGWSSITGGGCPCTLCGPRLITVLRAGEHALWQAGNQVLDLQGGREGRKSPGDGVGGGRKLRRIPGLDYAIDARVSTAKCTAGNRAGLATRGHTVAFGEYGLMALERCWLDTKQIEAVRVVVARNMKRHGKMWIRVFPQKSYTKKPLETRMGKGKGPVESWVAVVRPT